ncbi:MAG: TonB-linked outer membrane protein SusC/RagA family [Gemmatimonadetes bacterium]|nr:TonB-linked outer membrane protein SusC/RagA family [Gemmatimonadota bacterium]
MRRVVKFVAAAFAVLLLPAGLAAQGTGSVTGVVTDAGTQRPVQDVQVSVTGTQRGALTDASGRFTIVGVPSGAHEVRARRVGYAPIGRTVTVPASGTATVNFTITQAVSQLQEVVVNAITGQAQRRSEVGTNVGQIDVAALNQGPITKMADVLQGRVAGVNLSSSAGTAGASQRIRIRGANSLSLSNEPLLYVDGVLISNAKGGITLGGQDYSRLNDLNPEEIENIEILKGPAASAIYGSAAANGVILLTTKKGRAGATRWGVYAEGGTSQDIAPYQLNWATLQKFGTGTEPYYDVDNEALFTRQIFGNTAPYDLCPNYRAAIPAGQTIGGLQTCTQDVTLSFDQFRDPRTTPYQNGARTKGGISASGGSEALTFFVSGDKERELGVLRPNTLDRTSVRANLNARLGNNATFGVNSAYIQSATNRLSNDNSIFSPIINAALGPAQYMPGMESDTIGSPGRRPWSWFGYNTPDQRKVTADQGVDRFIIGANTNYTPLAWLRLNANAGLDLFARADAQTIDPASRLPLAESYILGNHYAFRGTSHQYTSNASATGTFTPLTNLTSNTTVGGSFNRNLFEGNDCYGIGIPSGTASCSATTSQFAVTESYSDERTLGLFARQELNYGDRLFVAGSLRADNNSGLSREISGLSYFPSINASWIVSKESFFPQSNYMSNLRLRAAYGQAGQRPGSTAGDTRFASAVTQIGTQEIPALVLSSTGNPNLKVERTTEVEGGFDAGFFGDRVTAEYTAFSRRSKDALVSRSLAPSAGLTGSVFQNLGSVRNWGQELGLALNVLNQTNVQLSAHATATTLKNRIENLGAGIAPISIYRGEQQHREGYPTGAYFSLPIKYNDLDGNGKLSRAEVTVDTAQLLRDSTGALTRLAYLGPSLPTNTQSISGDLTLYNMVTFSTLFERRAGNKQLNGTESFRCLQQASQAYYSQCSAFGNPNSSLDEQAAAIAYSFMGGVPYGYIEDASFTKWREFSVRFNVPQSLGNRARLLNGASVSLSGRNLKTWTKYRGLDPEIAETGGASNFSQGEFNTQPPVRTFTLRFDFKP